MNILMPSSLVILLGFVSSLSFANTSIDELLTHYQAGKLVGISVYDLDHGKSLYSVNPHASFHPGSVTKLFTSYAALSVLGPEHRFKTHLQYNPVNTDTLKGDVAIHFEGDPTLTLKQYRMLIEQLHDKGIKTVEGNFVLDDTAFPEPYYAPGWTWDDFAWGYAPPITGLSLDKNAFSFLLHPSEHLNGKAQLSLKDDTYPLEIIDDVSTVSTSMANDCYFDVKQKGMQFSFTGCWPIKEKSTKLSVANRDIKQVVQVVLTQLLQENGIHLQGEILYGKSTLPTQYTIQSVTLKNIVEEILKDSDNFYAESILKALGYHKKGIGTFHEGLKVVKQVMREEVGIDTNELNLSDGSGLSQYNLVSPQQITRLLTAAKESGYKEIFKQALSISGEDGTLNNRLSAFDTKGRFYAKTGTLSGHSALCGYFEHQGRSQTMSIMLNNSVEPRSKNKAFEDQLVLALKSLPAMN